MKALSLKANFKLLSNITKVYQQLQQKPHIVTIASVFVACQNIKLKVNNLPNEQKGHTNVVQSKCLF